MSNTQNINWKLHAKIALSLVILQLLIDFVFIYLYPTVNPIRATLIALTALVVFFAVKPVQKFVQMKPWIAFLPVYSSALFGALLINGGVMTSKSLLSGIVHVLLSVVTYVVIVVVRNQRDKR